MVAGPGAPQGGECVFFEGAEAGCGERLAYVCEHGDAEDRRRDAAMHARLSSSGAWMSNPPMKPAPRVSSELSTPVRPKRRVFMGRGLRGYIGVESMWGMFQLSTTTVMRRNFGGAPPSNTHSASYVPKL